MDVAVVFESGVVATSRRVEVALRVLLGAVHPGEEVDFVTVCDGRYRASIIGQTARRIEGTIQVVEVM